MPDTTIYDSNVAAAAAAFAVPAEWIKAVIGAETSFQYPAPDTWEPLAGEYSYGPMQVLLSTAQGLGFTGSGMDLDNPIANIPVGASYLAELRDQVGDDFRRVYSAYVSGNPDLWQTSSQVSADVTRAVNWLMQFGGSIHSLTTAAVPAAAPDSSSSTTTWLAIAAAAAAAWLLS